MDCSINSPALSLWMKHLVIGQRQKDPNFSAFHWSSHGRMVSIGQHFVATRVVHLPESTETSLITESDQSGSNHQLLQLCTARTAWSESDQAMRPCISAIAGFDCNRRNSDRFKIDFHIHVVRHVWDCCFPNPNLVWLYHVHVLQKFFLFKMLDLHP